MTDQLLLVILVIFLGYALARWEFRGKRLLSVLVGLPLVLPPTAVGFLLLRLLAADGPLGRDTLGFDPGLLLTWKGAVLAAGIMSLPPRALSTTTARRRRLGFRIPNMPTASMPVMSMLTMDTLRLTTALTITPRTRERRRPMTTPRSCGGWLPIRPIRA